MSRLDDELEELRHAAARSRARLEREEKWLAAAVRRARLRGASWEDVGEAVGMARQNAWRKWGAS